METVDGKELMTSLATTTISAKRLTWNTGAWTYQEYILGNRLLAFTDTYVFFKCSTSMFRDDAVLLASGPLLSIPIQSDDKWISFALNDIPEDMDPRKVWKECYDGLLTFYLRRNIKYKDLISRQKHPGHLVAFYKYRTQKHEIPDMAQHSRMM